MNTIDELLMRWNAPMPPFFQLIYRASLVLLAICSGLILLNSTLTAYGLPVPLWLTGAGAVAGAVSALISRLTVDWNAKRTSDRVNALRTVVQSPWYFSLLAGASLAGAGVGWCGLAMLLCYVIYWPVARLVNRYVHEREQVRLNTRINREVTLQVRRRDLGLPI